MSIKLVSWNVNGIRAVSKKEEFWDWFDNTDADIINFQEVRATQDKIPEKLADVEGFHQSFNEAEKKGYSGVGTYSKIEPLEVVNGLGVEELDSEGRVLRIKYPDFYLYNIYFPNSGMNAKRLDFKVDFCKVLLEQLVELKNNGENVVITGDYNIAHHPIDVYNPKNCEGKSGYLPEERAWLDELEKAGFVDTFRIFDEGENNFTWWSYRTKARDRNAGWRLDYFYVNEEIRDNVKSAEILSDIYGSDHCPVTLELEF
ncbi:exodeoxyribonuclease III [uncultured Methanobrevibacter sp.]|uniref:exodeoxyribonuclease III n=1 Tax=uncultured Methanobrevibacter sp. TaxID=253161 RepID=UPI0025FD9223|nr:exodeoxyribonuclease III [uncultured Methanobrevibacter sp.]